MTRRDYRRKLSGPIADRIDITRVRRAGPAHEVRDPLAVPESSATVPGPRRRAARRAPARAVRRARRGGSTPHVPGPALRDRWPLHRRGRAPARHGGLRRVAHPARRHPGAPARLVGRRPAGVDRPGADELEVALRLRTAARSAGTCSSSRRAPREDVCDPRRAPTEAERLARVVLSRVGEPGDPRLTGLVAELGAVAVLAALREQSQSAASRPAGQRPARATSRSGSAPSTPGASSSGPHGGHPLRRARRRRVARPASTDLGPRAAAAPRAGASRSGCGCRGPRASPRSPSGAVAVVGSRSATHLRRRRSPASSAPRCGRGRAHGGLRRRLRHRPGRAPGRARGRRPDRRGAGLRGGPGLPRRAPALLRATSPTWGCWSPRRRPGCAPTRIRFLARNRLIAALTRGTVVVEAAVRSGALNTASWAAALAGC